ncbi:DUF4878 domain-containing protein [Glycomyces sp. TRM65418]|uniref:Rv0361 family membrane protein n=1 Tax=Glycomyces sp. TRM65418 TaxID=2867006 RepID=UPI001CE6ACF3|nr:DUF4878 domain-containing protein [Glycomyces sp. TRM65418]MCC3765701.1 DUF4878 domain-containing protein [Glycomyces sp. TRM65418]QZD55295.1 DUF4878 domain-containing protein [Glycomyces sp. TRM65418]
MRNRNKSRATRRASALAGGALALTFALAACGSDGDTPAGAVEGFLGDGVEDLFNAIKEGDSDAAVATAEEYFCAEDVEGVKEMTGMLEGMSEEEIAEHMGDDFAMPEDWSYEVGEVTEEGDTATVEVEMTENGETTDETFEMVKEDDVWKICGEFA